MSYTVYNFLNWLFVHYSGKVPFQAQQKQKLCITGPCEGNPPVTALTKGQ